GQIVLSDISTGTPQAGGATVDQHVTGIEIVYDSRVDGMGRGNGRVPRPVRHLVRHRALLLVVVGVVDTPALPHQGLDARPCRVWRPLGSAVAGERGLAPLAERPLREVGCQG